MARQLILSAVAYTIALTALLSTLSAALQTTDSVEAMTRLHALHTSGGISASKTHIYAGTDTGTIEKRDLDGALVIATGDYTTGAGKLTFNTSTNRIGGFTAMDPYADADVFYFCSEDQNGIFRYNTADDSITRMVGDELGQEGMPLSGQAPAIGTAAHVSCGLMASGFARNDAKDRVYAVMGKSTTGFYSIVALSATVSTAVDAGSLSFVLGSGLNAHVDGSGTNAAVFDVTQMIYYRSPANFEYLVIASQDVNGPIRYLNLATGQLKTTAIPYSSNLNVSGTGNDARMPFPTGLVRVPGKAMAYGCTENLVFALSWEADMSTFHVEFHKGDLTPRRGAALTVSPKYLFFGNGQTGPNEFLRFNFTVDVAADAPAAQAPGLVTVAGSTTASPVSAQPGATKLSEADYDAQFGAASAVHVSFAAVATVLAIVVLH